MKVGRVKQVNMSNLQYYLQSVHLNQILSCSVAVSSLASWYSDPDVLEVTLCCIMDAGQYR